MKCLYIKTPPIEAHSQSSVEDFGQFIDTLRKVINRKQRISFEIIGKRGIVYLFVILSDDLVLKFQSLFYSTFPLAEIVELKKDPLSFSQEHKISLVALKVEKSFVVPIKTFNNKSGKKSGAEEGEETETEIKAEIKDSMSTICSFLSELHGDNQGFIQIILRPHKEGYCYLTKKKITKSWHFFKRKFRWRDARKEGLFQKELELMEKKAKSDHVKVSVNLGVISHDSSAKELAETFFQSVQAHYSDEFTNKFSIGKEFSGTRARKIARGRRSLFSLLLNVEEFTSLLHLPSPTDIPHFSSVVSKKAEPPADLPGEEERNVCSFGMTNYHGNFRKFGLLKKDRARHLYVIGKSGSGKSKLLELLIKSDLENGDGLCVIDPHGDLIDNTLQFIPQSRIDDVIIFNPLDVDRPVPFNPLEQVDVLYKTQVSDGFVNVFRKAFGAGWNTRLEHVLRYSVLALLDTKDATVFSVQRLVSDREFRQKVIRQIKDDSVKNFWTNEFPSWTEKYSAEAINPLLNKMGQLSGNTMIKNVISIAQNTFNIREVMDNQKILLIKLPKGVLGEESIQLLGSMFITKIYQAAMSRQDIAEADRKSFYLYVDEFQNFTTDSFGEILSEARKYKLSLNLAHQFLGQLSEPMKKTIFGNVGNMISFRTGGDDAKHFVEEYTPVFIERDLINLGVQEFYSKITIEGEIKKAFSGKTIFLEKPEVSYEKEILEASRNNFGVDLEENAKNLAKQEIIDSGGMIEEEINVDPKLYEIEFPEPI